MDITVDLCGEAKQFVSYGETVQELLDRNGITLEENSVVSVELDAQVEDGMTIAISDTVVSTEQYTLSIPYEVTYQDTDLLLKGKEVVLTVGQEGQLLCTAEVTYINGVQADSKVISEEVTTEPVVETTDEVVTTEAPVTEAETEAPAKKGCGSVVGGAFAVVALLAVAFVAKKKED
jgi:uncharacterized protein YabE (DUF348 family)